MTRDKLNATKIDALIRTLEAEGVLSGPEAEALLNSHSYQSIQKANHESSGRPDFSKVKRRGNGNGNGNGNKGPNK
jgi:hypothetical protein